MSANPTIQPSTPDPVSTVITIDPTTAFRWLSEYPLDTQRPINWRKVEALARALTEDRFWPGTIVLAAVGTATHILDGQHRLNAVVMAQQGTWFSVLTVHAPTLDEARLIYSRIDPTIAGRSVRQSVQASGVIDTTGLTVTQAGTVSSAAVLLACGFRALHGPRRPVFLPDERVAAVAAWAPVARQYFDAIEGASHAVGVGFKRANTTGVALLTFRYRPELASSFWGAVASNDGLDKGTPQHTLLNHVLLARSAHVSERHGTHWLAACWNAFYDDRALAQVKSYDPGKPIQLRGTPLNGRQDYCVRPGTTDAVPVE